MTSATMRHHGAAGRHAEGRGGMVVFAGTLVALIGFFNLLDGIVAIAKSSFFIGGARYVVGDLRAGFRARSTWAVVACVLSSRSPAQPSAIRDAGPRADWLPGWRRLRGQALEVKSPGLPPVDGYLHPCQGGPRAEPSTFLGGASWRGGRNLCGRFAFSTAPMLPRARTRFPARFVDWPDGRHDRDFRLWHGRALDPIGRPARGGTLRVQERVPGKGPRDGAWRHDGNWARLSSSRWRTGQDAGCRRGPRPDGCNPRHGL